MNKMNKIKCGFCKEKGHNKLYCPKNTTIDITIDRKCPICYIHITNKKGFVKTNCYHVFCYNCFTKWTYDKNTCPLCRKVIKKPNKIDIVEVEVEVPVEVEVEVPLEVIVEVPVDIRRTLVKYLQKTKLEIHFMYLIFGSLLSYLFYLNTLLIKN